MQPPADKSDADQANSADGSQPDSNFANSGRVIQPSPGFDPSAVKLPKIEDPDAEAAPLPPAPTPGPASPPPAPPVSPTPPPGTTSVMPEPVGDTSAPPAPPPPPSDPPAAAAPPTGGDYVSNPLELFAPSWGALKLNFGSLVVAFLAYIGAFLVAAVVSGATAFIGSIIGGPVRTVLVPVGLLIGIILVVWLVVRMVAALMVLVLASVRGTKMGFSEAVRAGKPYGWRLIGYALLYSLMVAVGYVLLIVPGVVLQTWFSFGFYLIVDENLGVFEAFSRSKQLVSEHFWESLGPFGVMLIIGALGLIPFLGWLIELVLYVAYFLALPTRYVMLKRYKDSNATFPPMSKVNIILPIAAVALLVASFAVGGYALIHNLRNLSTSSNSGTSINYPG